MTNLRYSKITIQNDDFHKLVELLDLELKEKDGDLNSFYNQYNKLDLINHIVMVYDGIIPVACGAIKKYDSESMEIKRMYVRQDARGKGIASIILKMLEDWAKELSFKRCILETGLGQPEAIGLYEKNNYLKIENYGQYADVENSVCFEKVLID